MMLRKRDSQESRAEVCPLGSDIGVYFLCISQAGVVAPGPGLALEKEGCLGRGRCPHRVTSQPEEGKG